MNNKNKDLVFHFIYYHDIFKIPLITFLVYHRYNISHASTREWGKYLVILENNMISKPINYPIIIDDPLTK